jgi:hypothetical protein
MGWDRRPAADAYAAVVLKLTSQHDLNDEAVALRELLLTRIEGSWPIVGSYELVVKQLTSQETLKIESGIWRSGIESELDSEVVQGLVRMYAFITRQILAVRVNCNEPIEKAVITEFLSMLGHPLLQDVSEPLEALGPAAKKDFGNDIGAAVNWWKEQFGGDPATLRPPPIPDTSQ